MASALGLTRKHDSANTEMLGVYRLVTKKLHIRFGFP